VLVGELESGFDALEVRQHVAWVGQRLIVRRRLHAAEVAEGGELGGVFGVDGLQLLDARGIRRELGAHR
jgi:hypothetical protein